MLHHLYLSRPFVSPLLYCPQMLRCISAAGRPNWGTNKSQWNVMWTHHICYRKQAKLYQTNAMYTFYNWNIYLYNYVIYSRSQLSQVRKFLLDADYVAPLWLRASRTSSGSAENLKCCKIHRNGWALSKIFPGRLFNFRADSFGNEMKRSRRGNWVIIAKDEPGAGPNLLYRTFKIIIWKTFKADKQKFWKAIYSQ